MREMGQNDVHDPINQQQEQELRNLVMKRLGAVMIAASVVVALLPLTAGANHPPTSDSGVDIPNIGAAMNAESFWENYFDGEGFSVECTKYENHSGSIPSSYEAAVVKSGSDLVRVYVDPPAQVIGPLNPSSGHPNRRHTAPFSWVMKCNFTEDATTTTVATTTSTVEDTTTTTAATTTSTVEDTTTTTVQDTTTTTVEDTTTTSVDDTTTSTVDDTTTTTVQDTTTSTVEDTTSTTVEDTTTTTAGDTTTTSVEGTTITTEGPTTTFVIPEGTVRLECAVGGARVVLSSSADPFQLEVVVNGKTRFVKDFDGPVDDATAFVAVNDGDFVEAKLFTRGLIAFTEGTIDCEDTVPGIVPNRLPFTGINTETLIAIALLLIGSGLVLMDAFKRRET